MSPFSRILRSATYLGLGLAALISVFPFYWMLVSMTNSAVEVANGKLTFGDQLIANFQSLLTEVDMVRVLFNSTVITLFGTILTVALSSAAGYGFEIFRSRFKDHLFSLLLLMLSIPFGAMMIPLFVMFAKAGLLNSFAAILLPGIASIFIVFYFRQATKAFPHELRDAARIDGLNELQIFLRIYLPVMRSTYAAATVIVFMANWNAYLWPLIVLQTNDMKTITLVVSSLVSAYNPNYGVVSVAAVIATLPTCLVFFILQRSFVEGLTGGVK